VVRRSLRFNANDPVIAKKSYFSDVSVALVPEGNDYFRTYRTSVRLSIEFFMAEPLVLKLIIRRRRTCETACDKTVLATAHYLQQNSLRPSFST
jgi:hypothetical protein